MRVNLRKRLAVMLAAAGLLVPSAAWSADLNVNLLANPSFEDVDTGDPGPFTSVRILGWVDADGDGDDNFAYPYSSNYSGNPAPPASGDWHFTGGFNTSEGQALMAQSIDLSGGAAAALIGSGAAQYHLSGFFSSYLLQGEASILRASFLDGSGTTLGATEVGGPVFLATVPATEGKVDWGMDEVMGSIPSGTVSVQVEVLAGGAAINYDGYLDNVSFMVVPEPLGAGTLLLGAFGATLLLRRRK
jgi:hypothetical protein